MKKLLPVLALLLYPLALAPAQQGVDTEELKSGAKKVEFVNFTGTHAVIETVEQIRGIGRGLAAGVSAGAEPARWLTKYSVFHVPSVAGQKAFGSDIFSIDADSRIDHIDNVRRIVSAYLEQLYGYPRRDADLLALFVSYYNAVNRGDLPYFAARYLPAVAARLDAAKVGISTKYFEWPGATQLVVPISSSAGRDILGALDASELTSAGVTELLKAQEDKGVVERTAAADLKAREAEAAKKAIADEQARLEAQKKVTAEQEAAAKAAQAEADRLKAAGDTEAAAKAAEEARRQAEALAYAAGGGQGGGREGGRGAAGGRRPGEGARRGEERTSRRTRPRSRRRRAPRKKPRSWPPARPTWRSARRPCARAKPTRRSSAESCTT